MKKGLKRFLIISAVVIISLGAYAWACIIFTPKNEDDMLGNRLYNYWDFKGERENSLDLVVFGDSDAYCGYVPLELYRQTGATSYVRGGPREPVAVIKKNLKETLELQSPKFVILETACFFTKNSGFTGTYLQKFVPYFAPFVCHARWKELSWSDFVTLPHPKKSKLKGHTFNSTVYDYKKPEGYMKNVKAAPEQLQKSVKKDFAEIYNICKENDIFLILTCFPTPDIWSNAKSNAISALAEEYDVPFIDFNLPIDDFKFDYTQHFSDNGNHCNNVGATICTNYLIKYLQEHYTLPDHRDDEEYKDWDECLTYYDELKDKKHDYRN